MKKFIVLSVLLIISTNSYSKEFRKLQTDRYTAIFLKPSMGQINPLEDIVQIRFPVTTITLYDAVAYALDGSGYSLVSEKLWTEEMKIMLNSKLPVVQRDLVKNPMTLFNVIEVLAGKPFKVVTDPLRRRLSFELKDEYRGLING